MESLNALTAILNAAIEHCPQNTQRLFVESAQKLIKEISDKLPRETAPKE